MALSGLALAVQEQPRLARVLARAPGTAALDLTGPPALRPFVIDGLVRAGQTVLAVAATMREVEDLAAALGCLLDPDEVEIYPAWETLPHERLSPRSDTVGTRLAVLRRLRHPSDEPSRARVKVIVAPVRSVLQPQVAGLADLVPVSVSAGQSIDPVDLTQRLADAAYVRVDLVEKRGEFAVRGGIIDVFPPTTEHPVRVDFFGDEVEELRYFSVADQRALHTLDTLWAPPCRELLLTDAVRARAANVGKQHPELAEITEKISQGLAVEGMESLAPVLVDRMEMLVDLLPEQTTVVVLDPERVRTRSADLVATNEEFLAASWASAAEGGQAPIDVASGSFLSLGEVREATLSAGRAWWSLSPFGIDLEAAGSADVLGERTKLRDIAGVEIDSGASVASAVETIALPLRPASTYHGDLPRAVTDVRAWLAAGRRLVAVFEGHGSAQRFAEVLADGDVAARLVDDLSKADQIEPGVAILSTGLLPHGLVDDEGGLAILTGEDIAGQRSSTKDMRKMPARRKKQIDPLELKPGDYVVHENHGVGRYVEMKQREVQGATREYLVLEYAPSKRGMPADRLMVPTDQLDQVTRYVGGDMPSLDRLGGGDWAKRKGRARKAVRQIAAELIKLYAARAATKGHAFAPDTPWQRELEDAFAFTETPDQLTTVDEVKADMEREMPMDRLVCGDVGYGKTEIAVRAAFKAVQDGKQVIVLVPTTLLVTQHLSTFTERMSGFPVTLKPLSRFQTDKESNETIRGLAEGTVDIVIGTHRLLNPDIVIKDLGLVIVDEEQRFGVEHKEQLKRLRTAVDVLAMSATPIPRTLEMAITGIREMSTITTPPEERHPVLSYVGAHEDRQIIAAVRRELLREGQVFYIHNRVQSIEKAAARIRALVPEARVTTAHGQMGEHQLEQVMLDFWEKRFDVLVCTTIVESGLDVSNANTLIIERADAFGLSQLHQLRGRVGRGRERAYAYFLYPPDKPMTETAHERLATIAQHSDLGGGMAIAMKDLEIRGAGNLLGGEQSGHIADVGFDLYVRLVGEAVNEFKGVVPDEVAEMRLELPVDAHLPYDYVPSERLRLEMYKRLAEVRNDDDVRLLSEEMRDRYGALPSEVHSLLEVARFRARARAAGLTDVTIQSRYVRLHPVELPDSMKVRLMRLYPQSLIKDNLRTILVPRPSTATFGGTPLRDLPLLDWVREVVDTVVDRAAVPSSTGA